MSSKTPSHLPSPRLGPTTGCARYTALIVTAAVLLSGSVSILVGQGRGQGRQASTAPPAVYRTDIPAVPLDVIVTQPTETSAVLSVRAAEASTAEVTWSPGEGRVVVSLPKDTPTLVPMGGLRSNQRYRYRVVAGRHQVEGTVTTRRAAGSSFRFVVQADSHLDGNTDPAVYTTTLRHMAASEADFLIDLGDTFMVDKYPDHRQSAAQYAAQRHYLSVPGQLMAVFLALGNHDGEVGWPSRSGSDMSRWARTMRERIVPTPDADAYTRSPEGHAYAWTWADAVFIVLDPFAATRTRPGQNNDGWTWTLGRPQYDWLARTLAASQARHRFVFIHHLVGGQPGRASEARGGAEASAFFEWGGANGDGTPGFATARRGWPRPIHDLLKAYGVSAVFHGHDHLFAHQVREGVVYQAVPQPGHVRGDALGSARSYGYLSGTILGSSGFLQVTTTPDEAVVEYLKTTPGQSRPHLAHRYTLAPGAIR